MSEMTETLSTDELMGISIDNTQNQQEEVTYSTVKYEDRWAILIENGVFKDFVFTIENMRLTYDDEQEDGDIQTKIVENFEQVIDKEVSLDFEYDLKSVPSAYEDVAGNQEYFENVARNILVDVVMNYPELYKIEKEEEQPNSGE